MVRKIIFNTPSSLILEYADGGTLLEYINFMKSEQKMPEEEVLTIFYQIVKGLKAVHRKKVIHRDLKVTPYPLFLNSQQTSS